MCAKLTIKAQIPVGRKVVFCPKDIADSTDDAEHQQHDEQHQHLGVGQTIDG